MAAPPRPPRLKPEDRPPESRAVDISLPGGLYATPVKSRDRPPKLFVSRLAGNKNDKRGPKSGVNVALNAHKLPAHRSKITEKHEQVKTDEDYIYTEATVGRTVPEQSASAPSTTMDDEDDGFIYDEPKAFSDAPGRLPKSSTGGPPKSSTGGPHKSFLSQRLPGNDDDDEFIYDEPKSFSNSRGGPHMFSPGGPHMFSSGKHKQVKTDEDYIYDEPTVHRRGPEQYASSLTTAMDATDYDDGDGFIYEEQEAPGRSPGQRHKFSPAGPSQRQPPSVKTDEDYIYDDPIVHRRVPEQYASPLTTAMEDYDDDDGFIYDDQGAVMGSPGGRHESSSSQRPAERQTQVKNDAHHLYDVPTNRRSVPERDAQPRTTTSGRLRVTTRRDPWNGADHKPMKKPPKPLKMTHSLKIEGDQIKVVLQLQSQETEAGHFSRAPMRLVCLFDISGSMGQQFGSKARRRETKIVKMRNIAKLMANTLDDTDYLGVIAFGDDTEVLSPMTKNEPSAKKEVLSKVRELGRNGLSLTTNLSRAMFAAIDMFHQDSKQRGVTCGGCRDMIIVLTDGDINDGITDGQELVRQVRHAIRQLENNHKKDPSLTISTVVTGNNVSDAVYMLSKTCGSDAFFYIEKDTDTLEISALMPVLLRMNSVANSISVQAEALDPAELLPKLCSHEYMAHRPHERDDEICYFLHDLGVGMSKHLLIVLDKESVMCETDMGAAVLRVKVQYQDAMMEQHTITHEVMRSELEETKTKESLAVSIQDIRRISQVALRQVAEDVREEKPDRAVAHLLHSIEEVEMHVQKHCQKLRVPSPKQQLTHFVHSVTANLSNLMRVIEDSHKTTGNKWAAVKSVSSAIVREAPSATRLLGQQPGLQGNTPVSREVSEIRTMIRDQYAKNGVKSAIFYDFDVTMMEFTDSLRRGKRLPFYPDVDPDVTSAEGMTNQSHSEPAFDDVYVYSSQMTNS